MDAVKIIEKLHKRPNIFKFLASIAIPLKIKAKFKYNKDLTLYLIKLYTDTLDKNKISIWHNVFFPTEIFYAMNITPFVFETSSGILAKFGLANRLISEIEMYGLTRELCSFQKCVAGAFHTGLIPEPKMVVTSSDICDSSRKISEFFTEKYSTKDFYIDIPFDMGEDAVTYVKKQITEFITWLEINTKKEFSEKKFKEAIRNSNELRKNLLKVMELRREYPGIMGPRPVFGLFNFFSVYGTREAVKISETLLKELESKRKTWKEEKNMVKLLWLQFSPFYKEEFISLLEKNPHFCVVFEEMNNIYWEELSEENPLESIAKKMLSSIFRGSATNRIEKIKFLCDYYDINGVVNFSQFGCRQCNGAVRIIKDSLKEKDIAFLDLSGDCIDSRNHSEGQLKTRLEAFMELFE